MRRIVVLSFISLDGVMQAPGGSEEDPSGGSSFAGAAFTLTDSLITSNGVIFANYKRAGTVKTGTIGAKQ